jgi:hypothetical protein
MRRAARLRRALVLGGLICVGGWSAACHEEGDVHVNSLSIEGTSAVTTNQLKGVLETKATGWLPWAHKQYFAPSSKPTSAAFAATTRTAAIPAPESPAWTSPSTTKGRPQT